MKRTAGALVLLAALGGCMGDSGGNHGSFMGGPPQVGCASGRPREVPGVQGPWGAPVAMAFPYSANQDMPTEMAARTMMAQSMPLDAVQRAGGTQAMAPSGVVRTSATTGPDSSMTLAQCPPGGCPPGMPPAGMLTPPGVPAMPGMPGMPAMGGMPPAGGMPGMMPPGGFPPGAVAAVGALPPGTPTRFPTKRTEVRFVGPERMKVSWYAPSPDAKAGFSTTQLEAPGRYNFVQGAVYRLKLSNLPGRPGVDLYPTLEVVPSNPKTDPFLAHSAVPVTFTEEDLEQVAAGNYLVKVIYLPDPQFQDIAMTGPDEVVSSRLEPGVDPIAEALRRGSILLVIRVGNIDLEAPNTPAMDAPSPYACPPGLPPTGMMPGRVPAPMVPYNLPPGRPLAYSPSGPFMIMTPNGPQMINPNCPPGAGPGLPPSPMVLPGAPTQLPPAMPPTLTPAPPAPPTLPTPTPVPTPGVQQTQAQTLPTNAQLAVQIPTTDTASDSQLSRPRRSWFGSRTDASN